MERLPSLLRLLIVAACAATLAFAPAHARATDSDGGLINETSVTYSFEWVDDEVDDSDVFIEPTTDAAEHGPTQRFAPAASLADDRSAMAQFGPFRVVSPTTVRMAGDVDGATPHQFSAMIAAFPSIKRLEMIDCPGSLDDEANLVLARMVRRAGLATHVPAGGSIRSGAVELFLAGVNRSAAPDAEFGVHSWRDEDGFEARDFAADDPVHADYLNFYREMGMGDAAARAFYDFTNAAPFDDVHYMSRAELGRYALLN